MNRNSIRTAGAVSLLVACALCLCGSSSAALDAEVKKPYQLKVVLRIARHRLLTPVFKDQLRRQLRDSLQAEFGNLAQVEVVENHDLLKEIDAKGLQAALDGWKDVSPVKTHFVLIDFVDNQYEIQAGQHDGLTGLASPVRRVRLPDPAGRPIVARTIGRLIERDFGLVGTIPPGSSGDVVEVAIKGSELGVRLDRWLKKGEVFAIARLESAGGGRMRAEREPAALLQVIEILPSGACRCRLFKRLKYSVTGGPGVVGYRCLKLGTITGPLRLRIVHENLVPLSGIQVRVSPTGFRAADAVKQAVVTGPDGLLPVRKDDYRYDHIAFVRILAVDTPIANIPVAIIDDRTIVCRVNVDEKTESLGQLNLRKRRWVGRIVDTLLVQAELSKQLAEQMGKSRHKYALDQAQVGLQALNAQLEALDSEAVTLRGAARGLPAGTSLDLTDGEQRLQQLQAWKQKLRQVVADLENVLKEKNDEKQKQALALLGQARALEDQSEYEQAIKLYDEALKLATSPQPKVKAHLASLRKRWEIKSKAHDDARKFIYGTWATLTTARDIQDNLGKAREAFQTCRKVNDSLSVEKLLLVCITHTTTLQKELEVLKDRNNEDARDQIKTIDEAAGDLEKLLKDGTDYLKTVKSDE
jgi:tetratricopeptide (TPR) repeat protein